MVTSLTYTLLRDGRPSPVRLEIAPQPDGMTYLITFRGPGVIGGSVPDGHYTLITRHDRVAVLSGPPMTADDVNTFDRLSGDVDGDGVVDAVDRALLMQAEADPDSPDAADFEYNGKPGIDKKDIAEFNQRSKGRMDPPKKAPAKFRGRTVHHQGAVRPASSRPRPAGPRRRQDRGSRGHGRERPARPAEVAPALISGRGAARNPACGALAGCAQANTTIFPPALFSSMRRWASTISSSWNVLPTWTCKVPAAICPASSSRGVRMKSSDSPA
jgi:hypothetical protein